MTVLQALVLGVLQGLAEFLPISSSAHLTLAPWLLGWRDPGLAFDVALHFGTLVAVLWYFRAEWVRLAVAGKDVLLRRRVQSVEERRVVQLVVATIPGVVGGLLLEDYAETTFRAPALTAAALAVMGIVLWVVDARAPRTRGLPQLTTRDALLIGLAQVLALVPGVSRSGATMTAGRALRLDRTSAAVFSFLMLMPITAGAAVLKVPDALREHGITAPIVVGVVAAAVSSWAAIAILLRYVARHSYGVFAVYRVALGVAALALYAARG
jgi:undecaprenyl-diphosphatase